MGLKRIIFASDLHGDYLDEDCVNALYQFTVDWNPHIRVFGGDLFDLRPMRKNASAEDRSETIRYDLDAGIKFLKAWKPHWWLRGNHDERLWEFAEKDGLEGEFAKQGVQSIETICKKLKIKTLPYCKRKGVLEIGKLKMLHGYYAGVNAARQHAITYGNCLFGHVHTIDQASVPGLEKVQARSVGALCRLDMPYNARMPGTLRHQHGFSYGVIDEKTGSHKTWQAQKTDVGWLATTKVWQHGPKN